MILPLPILEQAGALGGIEAVLSLSDTGTFNLRGTFIVEFAFGFPTLLLIKNGKTNGLTRGRAQSGRHGAFSLMNTATIRFFTLPLKKYSLIAILWHFSGFAN